MRLESPVPPDSVDMGAKASYFKIGIFVISGVVITVVGVIVLGAGVFFRDRFLAETYFRHSVQGLEVGSPVKFRGVVIGEVEEISIVNREYETDLHYVLVRMALFPDVTPVKFPGWEAASDEELREDIAKETELGLRIRITFQGLTGTAYLEADYLDPNRYPPLNIDWKPKYPYCASARSTFSHLSESVERITTNLEDVDFNAIGEDLQRSLKALTRAIEGTDFGRIGEEATQLLSEARETNRRIGRIFEDRRVDSILTDASATFTAARRIVEGAENPMGEVLADLPEVSASLENLTKKLDTASEDLPETFIRLKRVSRRLDELLASKQPNIERIIENADIISRNLRELSERVKGDPSILFFGEKPPRASIRRE